MPSHRTATPAVPPTSATTGYRALLRNKEFSGLYFSFALTVTASTLSGFALGTLVNHRTGSPFLTAVSMYGATFAAVLGALTLMSVADGERPRRTLLLLQLVSLVGVAAQAVPGLPLAARFALLLTLGFFQSLGTGTRLGLLAEVVPGSAYAPARSLMNVTSGATVIAGYAVGAVLLRYLGPYRVFVVAAALTALGTVVAAVTVRERSIRFTRRPGLRRTWTTNVELFAHPGRRRLLVNLWVPNGLIVGCEALFLSYDPGRAGVFLAAASAGMLLGDLLGDDGDRGARGDALGQAPGDGGADALPGHPTGRLDPLDLTADDVGGQFEELLLEGQGGRESDAGEEHGDGRHRGGRVDGEQQEGNGEQQPQGEGEAAAPVGGEHSADEVSVVLTLLCGTSPGPGPGDVPQD
ncbi:hypothetical protein ACIQK6_03520 [Streptomyces sp. NPDC091682]|uniref:hypothetical protein n=1 Tax=Streptomyces sp. NPDC091682 TaxID=3366005 RepID=UPI0037F31996